MNKKLIISLLIIIFISTSFIIFGNFEKQANYPRYKNLFYNKMFKVFMKMPDPVKSLFMIVSGKRNFSNLFNDYNVKFLPETQYINIKFKRKKPTTFDYQPSVKNSGERNTFYLETFENKIFLITKEGNFYISDKKNLFNEKRKIKNKKIETNKKLLHILDTLIVDNNLFISKVSGPKECRHLEILYSNINFDKLIFKTYKKFDECAEVRHGAGRIQRYNYNNLKGIIISTLDADNDAPGKKAQDDNSIYGKIVFVDEKSKDHQIVSKGHRNIQGLFVKDNIILSTEHGPRGGDEINKIEFNKNYGWPVVSYGQSYKNKNLKYLKSHLEHGFEEPLHVFLPSIGISELIILPNSFDDRWDDNVLVTSLNGRSIYRVKFIDENFDKILYTEKIYIGERIRDIKYIDEIKAIIIALETSGEIGVLTK